DERSWPTHERVTAARRRVTAAGTRSPAICERLRVTGVPSPVTGERTGAIDGALGLIRTGQGAAALQVVGAEGPRALRGTARSTRKPRPRPHRPAPPGIAPDAEPTEGPAALVTAQPQGTSMPRSRLGCDDGAMEQQASPAATDDARSETDDAKIP